MKKALLIAVLGGMSVVACAQSKAPAETAKPADAPAATTAPTDPKVAPGSADAKAIAAIRQLSSQVVIDKVGPAPMPGYREVVVSGQVLYVSDDGRYLMQGALLDMQTKRDMAQATLASVRKDLLAQVPKSERIIFSPPNPKYTVSVFTDIECGSCRKLHEEIAEYNKRGIAVEYVAFPRQGLDSPDYRGMVSVWCAPDRRKALAILLLGLWLPLAALAQVKGDVAPPVFRDQFEEQRFRQLTHELRCVMCQNQSLADSNAEIARDLRNEVLVLMRQGKTDAEIRDFMVARYGEFVLYKPRLEGGTMLLWFGPLLLILIGGALVYVLVKRGGKRSAVPIDDKQEW